MILITSITGIPSHFPGYTFFSSFSASIGAVILLASMIENIISKLVIGFLSDRIGSLKASISMLIINMLSVFILILSLDETTPITETCLFGSIYSISVVGFALLTKEFSVLINRLMFILLFLLQQE